MYGNEGRGGPRNGGPRFAPVKVGEEMDVKIESVGEKGDGVAKVKGYVIFVPGTKTGEEVHIKISKVFKNVGFGEVLSRGASAPAKDEESSEEYSEETEEEEASEPEEKKSSEDSDNFGEEKSEDDSGDFEEEEEQ